MALTKTANGRLWVKENNYCGSQFQYHACAAVGSLDNNLGAVTPIYCQDDDSSNKLNEVDTVQGIPARTTLAISAYLSPTQKSMLEDIKDRNCMFNAQIHYGQCVNPTVFNDFESILVLVNAKLTNYNLPQLTALTSEQKTVVTENFTVSVGKYYRIFPFEQNAINNITSDVVGFAVSKEQGCIDCPKDCQNLFITRTQSGSVGLRYSTDGGITFSVLTNTGIPESTLGQPARLRELNDNLYQLVTVAGIGRQIWMNSVTSIFNGSVNWIKIYEDATISINDIFTFNNKIIGVGSSGIYSYVMEIDEATLVATELENFEATLPQGIVRKAHWFNNRMYVSGDDGVDSYLAMQAYTGFIPIPFPTGTLIRDFFINSDGKIIVRTSLGWICSIDNGDNWETIQLTGNNDAISELIMFDDMVGFSIDANRIWRTLNGGETWYKTNQNTAGLNLLLGAEFCNENHLISGWFNGSLVHYR